MKDDFTKLHQLVKGIVDKSVAQDKKFTNLSFYGSNVVFHLDLISHFLFDADNKYQSIHCQIFRLRIEVQIFYSNLLIIPPSPAS